MAIFRRVGYVILVALLAVFIIIVSVLGAIYWLFTGKSVYNFASSVVYKITKRTKDVI